MSITIYNSEDIISEYHKKQGPLVPAAFIIFGTMSWDTKKGYIKALSLMVAMMKITEFMTICSIDNLLVLL